MWHFDNLVKGRHFINQASASVSIVFFTTASWPTTLPPASGKRRRHRGAAAAARPVADKELLTTASQPLGEVFVCSSSSCSRRGS